jgi:hypothetical protein
MVNGALMAVALIFGCGAICGILIAVFVDRRDAAMWWAWSACLGLGAVLAYICAQVITW